MNPAAPASETRNADGLSDIDVEQQAERLERQRHDPAAAGVVDILTIALCE
jgi:hypothetical protein